MLETSGGYAINNKVKWAERTQSHIMSLNRYSQFAQKMIGINRQIFRLNYVRTFFLSVSNTSQPSPPPETREKIKCLDQFEGTTTKGRDYKMALVKDNVRVMTVNDKTLNDAVVYWSIRVGVGYDDDPPHYLGLGHLLEHVIGRTYGKNVPDHMWYYCETMNFETRFSFAVPFKNHVAASRAWTEIIFSNSRIIVKHMRKERNRLDNEYHEHRNTKGFTTFRTAEILKQKQDITLVQFGCGNLKTLSQFDDEKVMGALKVFRTLYRRRPLNVCVYSKNKIEMDDVLHSLDIKGSITEMLREEAKEPNWEGRLKSVEGHHLVVQQSANDSIKLEIIYPFRKKLSLDEEDTFTIIGDLITESFEGQLGHVLFEKKMATSCTGGAVMNINSFVVTIWLTARGWRRFRQVTRMVHDYFQFLHDNWTLVDERNYRELLIEYNRTAIQDQSDQDYTYSIARCLGRVNNPFDEEDLFRPLNVSEEKHLISEQILNNKSIRHTIIARNETEDTIGTQFHYLETGLFAAPSNSFTLPQLETKFEDQGQFTYHDYGHISNANDEVMLVLTTRWKQKKTDFLLMNRKLTDPGSFGVVREGNNIICDLPLECRGLKKYVDAFHSIDTIDFKYFKQSLMQEYSILMTDSEQLAKSLLQTALENLTSTIKRDSVPLQYNVLKDMDFKKYTDQFVELFKKEPMQCEPNVNQRTNEPFNRKFVFKSINVDESLTVTLVFLQQPEGTEDIVLQHLAACLFKVLKLELRPNLYTRSCTVDQFGEAKGLLLTLVSVEEKVDQTGAVILDILADKNNREIVRSIMKKFHLHNFDILWSLYNEITKQSIIIQIVGHEKRGYPSGPFQPHFEQWLQDHEEQLQEINNL